ncbi:T9SS type A sorting domain-containing protein, partial [candidate division TA06 bacterium]
IQDTVIIEQDTTIYDDIVIIDSGQLIVRNCSLKLKGNITALDNALFSVDSADFTILQDFIYQFMLVAVDSAAMEITNTSFNSSKLPITSVVGGKASIIFDSVDMGDGFITFAAMEGGSIDVEYSSRAGEFVVLGDSANLSISHSDTVLVWLGFPENSSGELHGSPGMEEWVDEFTFPDSTCSGIGYSIQIDSLYGLILATMAVDSTDVTVYDAELQSCGNIFWKFPVTDTISGLVDESHYDDWVAPLPNRNLRLVNTSVRAWNLYFGDSTDLTIKSSIFGECLASDSSKPTIMNAIWDGNGGHIGATGRSFFLTLFTSLHTDALQEGQSVSMFFLTSFLRGNLIARDMAVCLTYNTVLANPVLVDDSATVMIAGLYPPSPAYINDTLSIQGSATMYKGSDSQFQFDGYRLDYASLDDTTQYFPITDRISDPIEDGELCKFDTYGLDVGDYFIRLWYFFSAFGQNDSLPFINTIYLKYKTGVYEGDRRKEFFLSVSPTLLNSAAKICYGIPCPAEVELSIYDVSGRRVVVLDKGIKQEGVYSVAWNAAELSPGVYFCRLTAGDISHTRKLVVLK